MARTKLNRLYYDQLTRDRMLGKMRDNHVTQRQLADRLGCTQPTINRKLKEMAFTGGELREVFILLGFTDREILEYMRGGIR